MSLYQFYGANLFSLDCEKSALVYSENFPLKIISKSKNHAELKTENGISIFLDKPSEHCNVSSGTITFTVSKLRIDEIHLSSFKLEFHSEKNKYASFLDEYKNRVWIFERPI